MQDMKKAEEIERLTREINHLNEHYQIRQQKFFFDYDGVIGLLRSAVDCIETTLRCERPENLPPDVLWSGRVVQDCEDVPDPYVFDGSMSLEDYKEMHRRIALDDDNPLKQLFALRERLLRPYQIYPALPHRPARRRLPYAG